MLSDFVFLVVSVAVASGSGGMFSVVVVAVTIISAIAFAAGPPAVTALPVALADRHRAHRR